MINERCISPSLVTFSIQMSFISYAVWKINFEPASSLSCCSSLRLYLSSDKILLKHCWYIYESCPSSCITWVVRFTTNCFSIYSWILMHFSYLSQSSILNASILALNNSVSFGSNSSLMCLWIKLRREMQRSMDSTLVSVIGFSNSFLLICTYSRSTCSGDSIVGSALG